jgi:UDP-N-acetylmuramyl pentapeptide phosphotransferase/UDP-N-acetylglucosamine-1-phosphate transferase
VTGASRLLVIGAGVLAFGALWQAAARTPFGRAAQWRRTNYRGHEVSLLGGVVAVVAAAAGCAVAAAGSTGAGRRTGLALVVVLVAAGAAGGYDDVRGDSAARGLSGHWRAALRGQLTSGAVKVLVLAVAGLAAAAILLRGISGRTLADGSLIAATANLANLFDLRPGRAAKLLAPGLLATAFAAGAGAGPLAWCAGVAVGVLPADVRERVLLGDAGANALGGALGVGLVVSLAPAGRLAALGVVVALTLLSERVSFSRIIDAAPPLRWIDGLGRVDRDPALRA